MPDLIKTMDSLIEQLRQLEKEIDLEALEHSGVASSLGEQPAQAFATITEFKAAIDRMRYIIWMYMEAAARSRNIPVRAVPPALRRHMQNL
jgi:hypothetical protein